MPKTENPPKGRRQDAGSADQGGTQPQNGSEEVTIKPDKSAKATVLSGAGRLMRGTLLTTSPRLQELPN